MNITLWIVAAALATGFLGAGAMKVVQPKQKLAEAGMGWVDDFGATSIKLIGALEVIAAIGLILPPATGIASVLTPLAAIGLVLLMVGGAATHTRRGEIPTVTVNLVLLALAALVAWGRLGPAPF